MLCENVKSYLANSKGLPFFYVVGDEDYKEILSEFTQSGVIIDRVSDFCPKDDKYPDIDDIIDHFRTLDMDYRQNKHVLIGLGEYLALRGAEITEKVLRRLKNTTLGTARVIILLRCVTPQINNLATCQTFMLPNTHKIKTCIIVFSEYLSHLYRLWSTFMNTATPSKCFGRWSK